MPEEKKVFATGADCGQEMAPGGGCEVRQLRQLMPLIGRISRIRYGDPREGGFSEHSRNCHDCGAAVGQFHHFGCDVERCPTCLGQLASCGHEFLPAIGKEEVSQDGS